VDHPVIDFEEIAVCDFSQVIENPERKKGGEQTGMILCGGQFILVQQSIQHSGRGEE
jgi:hypothetical protein